MSQYDDELAKSNNPAVQSIFNAFKVTAGQAAPPPPAPAYTPPPAPQAAAPSTSTYPLLDAILNLRKKAAPDDGTGTVK